MLKLSLLCQFAISLSGPHCILRISRRAHAIGIQIRYGLLCLAALLPRLDGRREYVYCCFVQGQVQVFTSV